MLPDDLMQLIENNYYYDTSVNSSIYYRRNTTIHEFNTTLKNPSPSGLPVYQYYSNNINGPGSASQLVTPFVVKISAPHIPEIQRIQTSAAPGQTLYGNVEILVHIRSVELVVLIEVSLMHEII